MLNPNILEERTKQLFQEEKELKTYLDGKAILREIEDKVAEQGLNGETFVELVFYINNKKYIIFYDIAVTRKEIEEDTWETNIDFIGCRF